MRSLIQHARTFGTRMAADGRLAPLAHGQSPQALFITCSDSRVVPSLITGAAPGDLFELRTAGGIVPRYDLDHPAGETATIEFAVNALRVNHIVVCGHSHCAAVAALARGDALPTVPALRRWLTSPATGHNTTATGPVPGGTRPDATGPDGARPDGERPGADGGEAAVRAHVLAQLERLRAYPCVAERLRTGDLTLHGWLYQVHTGAVLAHRPGTDTFQPL